MFPRSGFFRIVTKSSSTAMLAILVMMVLALSSRISIAQEVDGGEETLSQPVVAPSDSGVYQGINDLPESIRSSAWFTREYYNLRLRAGENGEYNPEARIKAFQKSQQDLVEASKAIARGEKSILANAWSYVGPVNTGGCTNALAIDPQHPNTVYAGAAGGGVWKSTNSGSSWTALTDDVIPDLAISTIAIDPVNTNNIYVGTGNPVPVAYTISGSGIYKSTDAGATWSRIGASTFSGNNTFASSITKILVHPTNPNVVLAAATNGGVYRSQDGGLTWKKTNPNVGGTVWDIVPGNISNGIATFYCVAGGFGVYKSTDDGVTWAKSSNGLPSGSSIGRAVIGCPSGNTSRVYVLMTNTSGDFLGLYRSNDSAQNFSSIDPTPKTIFKPANIPNAQGTYDINMAVSPKNGDTVLIGGIEAWRSTDGGNTWAAYSGYMDGVNVHVDHHAIAMDPNNSKRIFVGNDGGIYYSTDGGAGWVYSSNGYHTCRFYHLAVDQKSTKPTHTWAGAQDEGTWYIFTGSGGPTYASKFGGDGFQPIISTTDFNANTVYVEGPYGDISKTTNGTSPSPTWTKLGPTGWETANWDAPLKQDPKNGNVIYSGRSKVWRSTNGGSTWNAISSGLGVWSMAISPSNDSVIWAGTNGGKIYLSKDYGGNWTDVSKGFPGREPEYIVCHPTNAKWALASFGGYTNGRPRVMLTQDYGNNWTDVSGTGNGTLPDVNVRGIALDSVDPSNVWYAATDNGLYYTKNAGAYWTIAGSGLGLTPCTDVQIPSNKTTVRVATFGRGIWEADATVLPVELAGLEARPTPDGTLLTWHTDSERNDSRFDVMRSYNYQAFEVIGSQPGAGNSSVRRDYSYLDPKHDTGFYVYKIKQVDLDGSEHYTNTVDAYYGDEALQVDQNYPNPFFVQGNLSGRVTSIHYWLPQTDHITIKIYNANVNANGQPIRTMVSGELRQAGSHDEYWDGRDDQGQLVSSGIYFYTFEDTQGHKIWKKMVIVE